jgi:hypothetical protein
MVAYFWLYDVKTKEAESLQVVDDKMRVHFGAPPNDREWYRSWYDSIGLFIALGNTKEQILADWPDKADIVEWLYANYTAEGWIGR